MRILSVNLFLAVVFMVNQQGEADIGKMAKDTWNKAGNLAKNASNGIMGQGVEFMCENFALWGECVAKFGGTIKCDDAHKDQEYCKCMKMYKVTFASLKYLIIMNILNQLWTTKK